MFGLVILLNDNKYLVAVDVRGLRNPPNNMAGPYKRGKVWEPKHKDFKEDLTECPFDPNTGEMKKDFKEEQLKRTDLNWDGQE